jgi:protein-S-isoprenylcysteine O-methyltransferase Ste14
MSLEQSLEKQGNFLFKYRGQFPVILFLLSIPFIYLNSLESCSSNLILFYNLIALLLSTIGFLIRFYTIGTTPKNTSGRNTEKQIADALNTTGIYSLIRHPLYLGNYLIWIGICFFTYNLYFVLLTSLLFWLYYERIIYAEEKFLESKFQDSFIIWSKDVSAFFPSSFNYKKTLIEFSIISVLRREYSSVLSAVFAFLYVDMLRNFFNLNKLHISANVFFVSSFLIVIVLILRTLKHNTSLLNEQDRS